MRILVVSCGGIAAERPLQWMLEAGHQVCLLGDHDFYANHPPANYCYVPSQWALEKQSQPDQEPDETQMAEAMAPRLRALADEFQPDLVHVNAIGWHAHSCALAGVRPLVVSAWGFLNHLLDGTYSAEHEQLVEFVLKGTDLLVVETPQLLKPVQEFLSQTARVELIPLGTKTQVFRRGAARSLTQWKRDVLKLPEETKVVLSPRGWSKVYGHEEVFQAYALGFSQFTQPTALVFLAMARGSQTEAMGIRDRICSQAEELNLRDRIQWLPYFPYLWMPTIYNLADVVINYPHTDAFPSTLIEAVACECPVLSADLPAYRGTFVEQVCTLVPPKNPAALAEALIQVINQPPEERQEHLAWARQRMIDEFDESRLKQRFLEACESICRSVIELKGATREEHLTPERANEPSQQVA